MGRKVDQITVINSYERGEGIFSLELSIVDPPILKASLSGHANLEDARKTEILLDETIEYLKTEFGANSLYFITDMTHFHGTTWKAKLHFQRIARRFFSGEEISHVSLINPSILVQNMVYLVKKLNPEFRITVQGDEAEAIQTLEKTIEEDYQLEFGPVDRNGLLTSGTVKVNGVDLPVKSTEEWCLRLSGNHSVQFFLINNEIVLYKESGSFIKSEDAEQIGNTIRAILSSLGDGDYFLITDFSESSYVSLKSRKALEKQMITFRSRWKHRYHIFPRLIRTMYLAYSQLNPSVRKNSTLVSSWMEALSDYLGNLGNAKSIAEKLIKTSIDYDVLTREELIEQLKSKENEIEYLHRQQDEKIQNLFDSVSRISWDENFQPGDIHFEEVDDPFAPLANAISLLEHDIFEIINDLKDFNAALESKVIERTSELEKQNEELVKVNSELDSFVYSTSHDLRAPLVSVMGLIDLSKREKDPELRSHYFEMIVNSMQKLDSFIKDITDFSRNARMQVEFDEIDFNELVESIFEELQYMQGSDLEKRINIENVEVFVSDPRRLKMIFNNLISNAIRYQSEENGTPYVAMDITTDEKGAHIVIHDNGLGIRDEYLARIFDMFFRASETSQGSGLGLYIVKEAVEKLGGSISVDSKQGEGTRFEINLPS